MTGHLLVSIFWSCICISRDVCLAPSSNPHRFLADSSGSYSPTLLIAAHRRSDLRASSSRLLPRATNLRPPAQKGAVYAPTPCTALSANGTLITTSGRPMQPRKNVFNHANHTFPSMCVMAPLKWTKTMIGATGAKTTIHRKGRMWYHVRNLNAVL